MANDSSTGGYLAPADAQPPPEDAVLDALFQQMVVGITGLPGSLVRPRWQPTVPKQPEASVNWCAIGVMDIDADAGPAIQHVPDGDGHDTYQRHEALTLLCSFYGPNGMRYAAQMRDGVGFPQNGGMLQVNEMGLISVGRILARPDLVNETWVKRWDLEIKIRRRVVRTYAVLNLLSGKPELISDTP